MDRLAQRIKSLRSSRGLSVEQAAVSSGLTVSMWYKVESGDRKPSVQTLEKVADALGYSIRDLFMPPDCTQSTNQQVAGGE